jgi:cytochrome d ubiquinol oxidase subunit II
MDTLTFLQIIWFVLIGILFAGYSVLDGFDLGTGSLLPFLAGSDEKKTEVIFKTIGPVWDGNEVWLITAGGALFAAFPHAYATVFSGFYLALMIVLFGLILRAVSIEFFTLEEKNKQRWAKTFFLGSLLPSILFGVALGNVIMGVPLDSQMEFRGSFFTLLRPFPLTIGLLGLSAILMQGITYTMLKTDSEINAAAAGLSGKIYYGYAALFVISLILSYVFIPDRMSIIPAWIATIVFALSMAALKYFINSKSELNAFFSSSLSFISLWGIAGAVQFPVLVKSIESSSLDITIYNASSGKLTLSVMLGIALAGMPLVIAYSIYVYRVFRGKIKMHN